MKAMLVKVFCMAMMGGADTLFADQVSDDNYAANSCFATDLKLGDSAFWAVNAVELFANKDYEKSIAVVDTCFNLWAPEAGHKQKLLNEKGTDCPPTGKVNRIVKRNIEDNYLMNDVSMALWAKARSLHKLKRIESAIKAYSQCVYMACGRAWGPKGWFWSPAQDCAKKAQRLIK